MIIMRLVAQASTMVRPRLLEIVVMMAIPGNFEIEAADYCDGVYEKYEKTKVVSVKR